MDHTFVVVQSDQQWFDLGFLQMTFLVLGKSLLFYVLIPDRTDSTRSHLPCWCFPEAMDILVTHGNEVSIRFAFCSSVSLCGTNQEQIFLLPKSSQTMVYAMSLLMPKSSIINLNISRRSCASICRTFLIISGVLLVCGRPECCSSSVISFPSRKHLNHSWTYFLLAASLPYIYTNISCDSDAIFPHL